MTGIEYEVLAAITLAGPLIFHLAHAAGQGWQVDMRHLSRLAAKHTAVIAAVASIPMLFFRVDIAIGMGLCSILTVIWLFAEWAHFRFRRHHTG